MTTHLLHVALSWGLAALAFGGMATGAVLRHRRASLRLRALEGRR